MELSNYRFLKSTYRNIIKSITLSNLYIATSPHYHIIKSNNHGTTTTQQTIFFVFLL